MGRNIGIYRKNIPGREKSKPEGPGKSIPSLSEERQGGQWAWSRVREEKQGRR